MKRFFYSSSWVWENIFENTPIGSSKNEACGFPWYLRFATWVLETKKTANGGEKGDLVGG